MTLKHKPVLRSMSMQRERQIEFQRDLSGVTSFAKSFLSGDDDFFHYSSSNAWRLGVVYRCVAAIAETIATMKFDLIELKNGSKYKAIGYRGYEVYATDPNEHLSWFEFMSTLISQALTQGNGYALIERDAFGSVVEYRTLTNGECSPHLSKDNKGKVTLTYSIYGKTYSSDDVIHIKCLGSEGYIGESILTLARKAVLGGQAQQDFNVAMHTNGLNLQGTLEAPHAVGEKAMLRLKESMVSFQSPSNANKVMILEEGLQYKRIGITPVDAQFIENRRFTNEDIARFFGVPLYKIMQLDGSTVSNMEQQDLDFYKGCLNPWIVKIEQQFDKKTIVPKLRRKLSHQFDVSELLRGDFVGRAKLYDSLFPKGAITPDEIRSRENINPTGEEASTKTYMQLAMSEVSKLDENRKGANLDKGQGATSSTDPVNGDNNE